MWLSSPFELGLLVTLLMALMISTSAEIGDVSIVPVIYNCLPDIDIAAIDSHAHRLAAETAEKSQLLDRLRGGAQATGSKESAEASFVDEQEGNKTISLDFSASEYAFSLYQQGDGSDEDPDGIPTRYLKMQGGDRAKAKKALEATIKWREENDVDTILARPHSKFEVCKKIFPHFFCGRDETDHVILLQRPGLINLDLAKLNNIEGEDLLYHYVYAMEYLWKVLEPNVEGTMTSIIDMTGVNFSLLTKRELLNVVKLFCITMDAHFPQRSHKTLVINSPKWFGAIYKLVSPLLRESTKEKISIYSPGSEQDEALSVLLSQCGDTEASTDGIGPSEMEEDLKNFVSDILILSRTYFR